VSRAASPPQAAPPRRKQVRRVRFEHGKTSVPEEESGTQSQKKPAKPPAEKPKRQTAAARRGTKTTTESRLTLPTSAVPVTAQSTKTETQATSSAAACAKELLVSTPKIDAMTKIAEQAVANIKKRETGIKFKEPLPKPEKENRRRQSDINIHFHLKASQLMLEKERRQHLQKDQSKLSPYRHKMFSCRYYRK